MRFTEGMLSSTKKHSQPSTVQVWIVVQRRGAITELGECRKKDQFPVARSCPSSADSVSASQP